MVAQRLHESGGISKVLQIMQEDTRGKVLRQCCIFIRNVATRNEDIKVNLIYEAPALTYRISSAERNCFHGNRRSTAEDKKTSSSILHGCWQCCLARLRLR